MVDGASVSGIEASSSTLKFPGVDKGEKVGPSPYDEKRLSSSSSWPTLGKYGSVATSLSA